MDADSIEDAKFKDGYFWVKAHIYDIKDNSDVESLLVHVDNFSPRVKETRPNDWFAFVPTKEKRVWCVFSEQMDSTTLTATNIKIQSLKADSFNYTITNFIYDDSIYKLTLEVDSFRFKDTVQVRLLDGVTDLAGKSIDTTESRQAIAYSWTFVVGVIQLTDNDLNDIEPDVHHGNIVWTQAPADSFEGEIWFYEFYNDTSYQISPGGGGHNFPVIWSDKVVWRRYPDDYTNPIYYYNGSSAATIASGNRGRNIYDIDSSGIALRSYHGDADPDTVWIEYYNFTTSTLADLDTFAEDLGRYYGKVDIDGSQIVWDHIFNDYGNISDVYLYNGTTVQNITSESDSSHRIPVISDDQIAWIRHAYDGRPSETRLYDGASSRTISTGTGCYNPEIDNGKVIWYEDIGTHHCYLHYFTGRKDTILDDGISTWWAYPYYVIWGIHNGQAVWARFMKDAGGWTTVDNATYYDGTEILNLVDDDTRHTGRIEVHDGFVVFDAWDGNDYEVYLYVGDTLSTPPAIVQNLQHEILDEKANTKDVKLTWDPNSETDLAGYKIYRSDSAYTYGTTPYDSVTAPDTTYTDTDPQDGSNFYVVTAYDNAGNESGFSNQTEAFIDVSPPNAPSELYAEKSDTNVFLTWNAITTDTLGNQESMDYYIIYCDTTPDFVPSAADSIGSTSAPDTTYTDLGALNTATIYYYLVMAVDSMKNKSKKSNMAYKFNKFINENAGATGDRNWISIPWYSEYDRVIDLTSDLSPAGTPLSKVTNLTNSQTFENWIYHPILGWYGDTFDISSGRAYEMVATKDTTLYLVGSNDPDGLVPLNENPGMTSDRNWVALPYNAVYSTVSDITDEYCPAGEPVEKITTLQDDQVFRSWIWDPDFEEWYGTDFSIEKGRGYEMVATADTTWNPTEFANTSKAYRIVHKRSTNIENIVGTATVTNRAPVWIKDADINTPTNTILSKPDDHEHRLSKDMIGKDNKDQPNQNDTPYREPISHIVRAHLSISNLSGLTFTAYRVNSVADVLTETMAGCGIVKKDTLAALYFDVGNFCTAWQDNEEVILITEAVSNGRGVFNAIRFRLDAGVDIQNLGYISLRPIPMPIKHDNHAQWNKLDNDIIIGYSVYDDSKRMNDVVLQDHTDCDVQANLTLKPVFNGGYETVYSSEEQEIVDADITDATPVAFAFSVYPNPSAAYMHIRYALPVKTTVSIIVYDVCGRHVTTLVSETQEPGYYTFRWDGIDEKGRERPAGIYFVNCDAGEYSSKDKVMLIR